MTLIQVPPSRTLTHQTVRLKNALRRARCWEVDCELFTRGRTFVKRPEELNAAAKAGLTPVQWGDGSMVYLIHHEAGTECGPACPNAYCPCAPVGGWPGEGGYPHHVQNEAGELGFGIALQDHTGQVHDRRRMDLSEALDRIGEGVEAVRFLRTRGV